MAKVYQQYFGKFVINSDNDSFIVGNNSHTLTNAYYYIDGYTGEGAGQLCGHIQAKIRGATGSPYPNANVSMSASTGKVTIALDTAAAITWTDSALQTLLGFRGTQSSAATHTATNNPRYVWRPSEPASSYNGDLTVFWTPGSSAQYRRSRNGRVYSIAGQNLYDCTITYQALPKADVLQNASTDYTSLQDFYIDVINEGQPVRIYHDRTLNTLADIRTAYWGEEEPAAFTDHIGRLFTSYNGYWSVDLPWWKDV